ncbi:hypothetical protein AVEN_148314-1, partial [Araneus ventricosus]
MLDPHAEAARSPFFCDITEGFVIPSTEHHR